MTKIDQRPSPTPHDESFLKIVFDGLESAHSVRAYQYHLDNFREWAADQGINTINRQVIISWKAYMVEEGFSASTINQGLTVIRSLAEAAHINGALPSDILAQIKSVKNVRQHGHHFGTWLSAIQAQELINRLNVDPSLSSKRNTSLIALMLGTGLRREEVAGLTVKHLVRLGNGRYIIHDIVGKGNRVRTIPIPAWALRYLAVWLRAADIRDGLVFRAINKADQLAGTVKTRNGKYTDGGLSASSVYKIIKGAGKLIGADLDPHDLRRTCAKLMDRGGADIAQIKEILGHASIRTTEIYLGIDLDTDNPATDLIPLK